MLLMLHPAWPGSFRRTVRHEDQPGVVYVFEPGDPVEVPEADCLALAGDVGKALVIPKAGTTKVDTAATAAAAADFAAYLESAPHDLLAALETSPETAPHAGASTEPRRGRRR